MGSPQMLHYFLEWIRASDGLGTKALRMLNSTIRHVLYSQDSLVSSGFLCVSIMFAGVCFPLAFPLLGLLFPYSSGLHVPEA